MLELTWKLIDIHVFCLPWYDTSFNLMYMLRMLSLMCILFIYAIMPSFHAQERIIGMNRFLNSCYNGRCAIFLSFRACHGVQLLGIEFTKGFSDTYNSSHNLTIIMINMQAEHLRMFTLYEPKRVGLIADKIWVRM